MFFSSSFNLLRAYLSFRWVLANSIMFNIDVIASITSISHHVAPRMIRFVVYSANFNERRLLTLYMQIHKMHQKTSKKRKTCQFLFSILFLIILHIQLIFFCILVYGRVCMWRKVNFSEIWVYTTCVLIAFNAYTHPERHT